MSKYRDIKEKKRFYSSFVNIDRIDFRIKVDIQQLEDKHGSNIYDTFFGVYLCAYQDQFIRYAISFCIVFYRKLICYFYYLLRDIKIDYSLVIFDQFGLNKSIVSSKEIFKIFFVYYSNTNHKINNIF